MNQNFPKSVRLTKKSEFKNVFESGDFFKNSNIVFHVFKNDRGCSRIGIVARKKIGNAVRRNRIKRVFREAFRVNKFKLTEHMDIIIMPRINTGELTFKSAAEHLLWLFNRIENGRQINNHTH